MDSALEVCQKLQDLDNVFRRIDAVQSHGRLPGWSHKHGNPSGILDHPESIFIGPVIAEEHG